MSAVRESEEIKVVMKLNHLTVLEFHVSTKFSSYFQFIEILGIASLKLFKPLKNLKKLMCICLNQIFRF